MHIMYICIYTYVQVSNTHTHTLTPTDICRHTYVCVYTYIHCTVSTEVDKEAAEAELKRKEEAVQARACF